MTDWHTLYNWTVELFFHPISYNVITYTYDVTMSESLSAVIRAIVRQSSYSGPTVVLWHTVPSSDSRPTQGQLLSYDTRYHRPTVVLLRTNCCLMTHGAIVRQSSYSGPTVVLWHMAPSSDSRPTQGQLLSYDTRCHRPTVVLLRANCCLMTHGTIVRQSSYSGPTVVLWHTVPSSDSRPTQGQLLSYDTRCHRLTVVPLRANCCLMTHGAIVQQSSHSGPTVVLWHTVPSSDSRPTQGQLLSYDTRCHRPTVVLLRANCCLMTHGAIVRQSSYSGPTVVLWHTPYKYCVRFTFLIGPTRDFQKTIVSYIGARYTTNLHDFLCWLYVKLTTDCGVVCLIKISCMGIGPNFYMLVYVPSW